MKTRLFLFVVLITVTLGIGGCNPDEVEAAESQSKTLIIRATLADPIVATNVLQNTSNILAIGGTFNAPGLVGTNPSSVGQNQIEILQTAASNTALWIQLVYTDQIGADFLTGVPFYECNTVSVEVIFDGQTIYTTQFEMGSWDGTCTDGYIKNINLILP